jgi:nitroreductase
LKVSEAVATRRSVRGFLDRPVAPEVIRRVVERAARAPSGGNVQPWHIAVLGGGVLAEFKAEMRQRLVEAPAGEKTDYDIYPASLVAPYRDYRYQLGEQLYAELGVPREDKAGRLRWFARNYQFFDAPVALFCSVHRQMGPPQWSDLGMYLQTVMLLLREEGLDSCPQECWSRYPETVGRYIQQPPERMLFCGMAIGYADPDAPANRLRPERAPLAAFAEFHGI